ncbi:MAG TPA: FHA domain-containing protein, partial [Kofleriaceae bacterium]|nr:FHA domain-containing protein [Kofleriaceae bacterium]
MSTGVLITVIVVAALIVLGVLVMVAKKNASPKHQRLCGGCNRVMLPVWTKCLFCGWAPVARLDFILGPMASQTLALSEEVTTIGSVAGNTVVLADPAVSRKHAGIRKVNGSYELADLGSTN